jgi:hypothetical protein
MNSHLKMFTSHVNVFFRAQMSIAVSKVGPREAQHIWQNHYGPRNTPAASTFSRCYGKLFKNHGMENAHKKVFHIPPVATPAVIADVYHSIQREDNLAPDVPRVSARRNGLGKKHFVTITLLCSISKERGNLVDCVLLENFSRNSK